MLDINPDVVCRLMELAEIFHGREQVVLPEDTVDPAEDWGRQRMADQPGDPTRDEFASIIEETDPDLRQEVVALLWLGRDDYDIEEWASIVQQVRDEGPGNEAEVVTDYLLGHPLLASYLRDGLGQHGHDCETGATPWT